MLPPLARHPQALEQSVDNPSRARIFLAGHSRGGAHAMLAALALSDAGANVAGVWTFSAPKVGKVSATRLGPGREGPHPRASVGAWPAPAAPAPVRWLGPTCPHVSRLIGPP
jgi:acetyl esterase/lipase